MSAKLDNARGLYLSGIRDGHVREAITRYTGERYTQHSTGVADGREGFIALFEPFLERCPERDIRVLRAIEDGRYCFVHVSQSLNGGESRWVTMDLFDTDADDRIVEHWDVIAPWVRDEDMPAGRSMTGGPSEITDLDATEENKALVRSFLTEVIQNGRTERIGEFVDLAGYVEHSPFVTGAGAELADFLSEARVRHGFTYQFVFRVLGQGNLVASYSKAVRNDRESAVFDLFRLDGGKIVEHWDVSEDISPRETWGNGGKF